MKRLRERPRNATRRCADPIGVGGRMAMATGTLSLLALLRGAYRDLFDHQTEELPLPIWQPSQLSASASVHFP